MFAMIGAMEILIVILGVFLLLKVVRMTASGRVGRALACLFLFGLAGFVMLSVLVGFRSHRYVRDRRAPAEIVAPTVARHPFGEFHPDAAAGSELLIKLSLASADEHDIEADDLALALHQLMRQAGKVERAAPLSEIETLVLAADDEPVALRDVASVLRQFPKAGYQGPDVSIRVRFDAKDSDQLVARWQREVVKELRELAELSEETSLPQFLDHTRGPWLILDFVPARHRGIVLAPTPHAIPAMPTVPASPATPAAAPVAPAETSTESGQLPRSIEEHVESIADEVERKVEATAEQAERSAEALAQHVERAVEHAAENAAGAVGLGTEAVVEEIVIPASEPTLAAEGTPKPDWIGTAKLEKGTYTTHVEIGPYFTFEECRELLPRAVEEAVMSYFYRAHDTPWPRDVRIPPSVLREVLIDGADSSPYVEEVESQTVGTMKVAYWKLKFSEGTLRTLDLAWEAAEKERRLAQAGMAGGLILGLLGTLFGYLKLDTATRGYYTGRLKLAAGAVAASLVSAAVLLGV